MLEKIRVLVVDDSAFMRKAIPQILEEENDIEVIATAKDGREAIKKAAELKPDVITLDVEMPEMGGLETLGYIMSESPVPVIMLSAHTPTGAQTTLQALEYGAVDFVCKPSGEISIDIKKVQAELVEKIRAARQIDITKMTFMAPGTSEKKKVPQKKSENPDVLVVIAASTGGPRALTEVIPKLDRSLPAAFLVVQHMSEGFTKPLADRLNSQSSVLVKEASDGEAVKAGCAYFARGNYHMEIVKGDDGYFISYNQKPTKHGVRPCADITMESAAKNFNGMIIGAIMTGMGRDGAVGAAKIRDKGGYVIVQDKETSVIYGMPKAAAESGAYDEIAPLGSIADRINGAVSRAPEARK